MYLWLIVSCCELRQVSSDPQAARGSGQLTVADTLSLHQNTACQSACFHDAVTLNCYPGQHAIRHTGTDECLFGLSAPDCSCMQQLLTWPQIQDTCGIQAPHAQKPQLYLVC